MTRSRKSGTVVTQFESNGQYIDGEWLDPDGEESISVLNPATEECIADVPSATESQVQAATKAANESQDDWRKRPAHERGELVRNVADLLEEHKDELAKLIVAEQGKPIGDAYGEINGAIDLTRYMGEWDRRIEGDILPGESRNESVHLERHPHGVVAGIIPWNYPIVVFVRKFAPALVAGNTLVAKPSELTPCSTLQLVELIDEYLEFPDGVFNLVTGGGDVGAQLVQSSGVDMVTMTGNVATGKQIMRDAADNLTKVSLELGGKAPAIVWKDADLEQAVDDIVTARVKNAGQVCQSAERVYVHSDVRKEFEETYVQAMEDVTVANPREDPDMGPQVSESELEKTVNAVEQVRDGGGEILIGGGTPDGPAFDDGYWYEPTVVSNVEQDDEIIQQEVFGPVTPIIEFDSFEEAVEYTNDSQYGLTSYVYTEDYQTAMRFTDDLDFGETYINRSAGESWHGHHVGWNESGLGGEDGKYGFLKYTQIKTVYHDYS